MASQKLRYCLSGVCAAAFFALCGVMLHADNTRRAVSTCTSIEISFSDSLKFVSPDDIKSFLSDKYGAYIGQHVDSVGLGRIENLLESRNAVVDAQAWISPVDGVLHIHIAQRAPVMRFESSDGGGFYVDAGGFVFPLHKSYTANVPVVSGRLPLSINKGYSGYLKNPRDRRFVEGLIEIERTIRSDRHLSNSVEGISIDDKGDIVLTLRRGEERFIFGDASRLAEKFDKMNKYFAYIVPAKGAGYYKSVNLKYKNQIICRQKDI